MNKTELVKLRESIGASLSQMAGLLGFSGGNVADKVRKMENGAEPITGPVQRVVEYLRQGVEPMSDGTIMPKFVLTADLSSQSDEEHIIHTEYPRFIARITSDPIPGGLSVTLDDSGDPDCEWLTIVSLIDNPVDDMTPLIKEALLAFNEYTEGAEDLFD